MSDLATKLTTIAENQQKVYDAGVQAEYNRFWDAYQENGKRTDYIYAFNRRWTDETFQPKYDITPEGSLVTAIFQYSLITDLKDKLEALGVKLDTSNCSGFTQSFQGAAITHIPTLDLRMANQLGYTFGTNCKVVTIDSLLVSETTAFQTSTFDTANWLQNLIIEGTIGTSINFQWSPLTKASIESVIAALSTDATGQTATFKKAAVDTAFETAEGLADGSTSAAWLALIATKENWTIALV